MTQDNSSELGRDRGIPGCHSCTFWRPMGTHTDTAGRLLGECRKGVPHMPSDAADPLRRWPRTRDIDWCGEHKQVAS